MAKNQHTVKHPITLAVDTGNGRTCVETDRGARFDFPSVIQSTRDQRLDGTGTQGDVIHVTPNPPGNAGARKSWAFGQTANLLGGLKIRDTSRNRIGSEYQLVLLLAATARALTGMYSTPDVSATVHWLLNVPPVYWGLSDRLYEFEGSYTVEFDKQVFHITGQVTRVFPEGAGAAACYLLDSSGRFANAQYAKGRTGIIDAGYRTIDYTIFEGPIMLENTAHSLTNSVSGVYTLMQQWANEDFGETWSEDEIETNIQRGYCILRTTKEQIDLSGWIDDLGLRLADLIENDILLKAWDGLGSVDRVVLAGGISHMTAHHLIDRYPNVILRKDDFPACHGIPFEYLNIAGHMRLMKADVLSE
jgi:hypothetical protein